MNWPHAVVTDGNGDYVISDTFNHRARRCDAGAPSLFCLLTPSRSPANAENKSVHRTRPCAPSPPVFTPISHLLNDWALFMHLSLPLFGQCNTPIVAPLHACRRGFAAFVFAFMVCLPQTASGVPAAGIVHPTAEELQHIGDVTGIFSWLGLEEPLRTASSVCWVDASPVSVTCCTYLPTCGGPVRDFRIPHGETQRDLTSLGSWPCRNGAVHRVHAWASLSRARWSLLLILQMVDLGLVVPGLRMWLPAPPPLEPPPLQLSVPMRSTQRWTLSLRVFHSPMFGRCSPPA